MLAALLAASIDIALAAPLPVGTRIRWVEGFGGPRIGVIVLASPDTLVTMEAGIGGSRPIPRAALRSLEVSAGRPNRCAHDGLVGAAVGAVTAIALVSSIDALVDHVNESLVGASSKTRPSRNLYAGLLGAGAGASIGLLVGAARHGPERWRPVEGLRLGLGSGGELTLAATWVR